MADVLQAVQGRIVERQIQGEQSGIEKHFSKLGNPNEPGGDDPRWRDKWKRDIQRAIDRQKKKLEKLKDGDRRERMEELVRANETRLSNTP